MSEGINAHTALVDHATWDANNGASRFNIAYYDRSSSDAGVGAHLNRPEHFGARADHHVCAERGVTLAVILASASQGDPLIQQTVIPHFSGFTDHNTHAVIDEDALPDGCSRMDLNTGDASTDLTEQPCGQLQRQARTPESMTEPMQGQSLKTGVAEQDFKQSTSSGVSLADDRQIGTDVMEHALAPCI